MNPDAKRGAEAKRDFWLRKQGYNVRHYCSLCRCWTQGDPKSIRAHEEAGRHRNNVKRRLDKSAEEKDKALERSSARAGSGPAAAPSVAKIEPRVVLREGDVLGQFAVRGQVYLEAAWHEDLLEEVARNPDVARHVRCQVALAPPSEGDVDGVADDDAQGDDEDDEPVLEWFDCKVLDAVRSGFTGEVSYRVTVPSADDKEVIVRPEDLRVVAPAPPPAPSQWSAVADSSSSSSLAGEGGEAEVGAGTDAVRGPSAGPETYKGVVLHEEASGGAAAAAAPKRPAGLVPTQIKRRKVA